MSSVERSATEKVLLSYSKFMVNLFRILAKKDETIFLSPFSIYTALVLAYLGSDGETAEEFQKYLHLTSKKEDLLEGMAHFLGQVIGEQSGRRYFGVEPAALNIATEMFVQKSYKLQNSFQEDVMQFIRSESPLVDFEGATEAARQVINEWVSERTNQEINDMIPEGILDGDTKLVLVNAIHFKGGWEHPYFCSKTTKRRFYPSSNESVLVDMMEYHAPAPLKYRRESTFEAVAIPYMRSPFSMFIFLPKHGDGLAALEQKLCGSGMEDIMNTMEHELVVVALPKFKVETFIDLNGLLSELGLETIFDPLRANFTKIHELAETRLVVSNVLHKTFVNVDENGTDAIASTDELRHNYFGSYFMGHTVYNFRADHPFIVSICYENTILFMGKVIHI